MPPSHLILCHPLLLLPSIFPSIRVFSNESVFCIKWPKYWSFSFSISPSNEHPGLISFRMDWLSLLVVQGTLKSLLKHHSSKASILQHSAFFIVQLSYPYMTTGKTIALTRPTFVGNPKGNQSWIFIGRTNAKAETPILWPPDVKKQLFGKDTDAGKDWRQKEKGITEEEMVGWHHWLDGHEFEQAPGIGDGHGSLVCCNHGVANSGT